MEQNFKYLFHALFLPYGVDAYARQGLAAGFCCKVNINTKVRNIPYANQFVTMRLGVLPYKIRQKKYVLGFYALKTVFLNNMDSNNN